MTGDQLYLWQVLEDGEWGALLATAVPAFGPTVLISRTEQTADALGLFAIAHHDATGHPVRCVRFDNPTVIRAIP